MSISTVVTRGYALGTIPYVVRRGYDQAGAATITGTMDAFSPQDIFAGTGIVNVTITGTMAAASPQDVFQGTGTVNPILSEDLGDGADKKKKKPIQDVSSEWEPVPKKRQSRRIFERTADDNIPIAPLVVSHETSVEDARAAHHKRLLEEDELILKMLMN